MRIEKTTKWVALLLSLLLCANLQASEFPEISGWEPQGGIAVYSRDDLWRHIDGAAELFLMYGFRMLRLRGFSKGDTGLTVEIYDMATPLNAFGIYTAERGDDGERLSIGAEAVVVPPYHCQLLKGNFYVKAHVYQGGLDLDAGKAVLRSVDSALKGAPGLPVELSLLPERDKVTGTERFSAQGYRGISGLDNVLYADYRDAKGNTYHCFVLFPSPGETADNRWQDLSKEWTRVGDRGHDILYRDVPYAGRIGILRKGRRMMGISGAMDMDEMLKRLTDIP